MRRSIYCAAFAAFLAAACGSAGEGAHMTAQAASDAEVSAGLAKLSEKRVFFGHQSVGKNIMDGIADLDGAGKAAIREARSPSDIAGAGFYHAYVGRNLEPLSKLADFDAVLRGGVGSAVEAAFLKFCYVDIVVGTDVDALFDAYSKTMERLAADFPGVAFIHFTVPLTADPPGIKNTVKRLIGRASSTSGAENAVRERYNAKMRAAYASSGRLFDLAILEASTETAAPKRRGGSDGPYYELLSAYTEDGGHLNGIGRVRAARGLLAAIGAALP